MKEQFFKETTEAALRVWVYVLMRVCSEKHIKMNAYEVTHV